ncbi:Homocysteine S-methyltransferase [Lindgomyces ingoldianus]|uniref:Homocysteine S-methyltransferase n=1 Tax=Lindgomyces ingoldianus TaxID=673940 RepID=A0ACB6QTW9_9PLEO|nr:Homocysteine S-methyltransferase [Lindgomyces ingoldianus]KAF2470463.1 Homocysteine S-methyltransferase [Lindgomyces ingoldianus]
MTRTGQPCLTRLNEINCSCLPVLCDNGKPNLAFADSLSEGLGFLGGIVEFGEGRAKERQETRDKVSVPHFSNAELHQPTKLYPNIKTPILPTQIMTAATQPPAPSPTVSPFQPSGHHPHAPLPTTTLSTLLSSPTPIPIILDGALATHLESLGANISTSLWSASVLLTNSSLIYRTHLSYYRAGASIAVTASYQASIPGLCENLGLSVEEAEEVVRKSVELAQEARVDYLKELASEAACDARSREEPSKQLQNQYQNRPLFIAGSIGPYGAYLANGSEYTGHYPLLPPFPHSIPILQDFHRRRISTLISAGVDILACETLPSLPETTALVSLLQEEFPEIPACFSFTLRDESSISDGTPLPSIVQLLNPVPQVLAIGVNCVPQSIALPALKTLSTLTHKPLIIYPNSGEAWDAETRDWFGARTEKRDLSERCLEWWEAGARIIGGCCRTTPEDIRVIAETLRDVESRKGEEP